MNTIKRNPVMNAAAIVGALMAIVTFAMAMGWLDWTADQLGAFDAMLLALVPLALALGGAWYARGKVTPTSDPRDAQGRKLVPSVER